MTSPGRLAHLLIYRGKVMVAYVFRAELLEEDDGRWSAWVEVLPGCAVWGYSREEALAALEDGVALYVEDMLECGEEVPVEEIAEGDGVTVTFTVNAVTV